MCERPDPNWAVCACGDPTCIRGILPWEPCQNEDRPDAVVWTTTVTDIDGRVRHTDHTVVRRG